jgi:hypothetical protein
LLVCYYIDVKKNLGKKSKLVANHCLLPVRKHSIIAPYLKKKSNIDQAGNLRTKYCSSFENEN